MVSATNEIVAGILAARCSRDAEFRQKMSSDPKTALEGLMCGRKLGADTKVHAAPNTKDRVHIPLPGYSVLTSNEYKQTLSEKELESVSGGEILIAALLGAGLGGTLASLIYAGTVAGATVAAGAVVATGIGLGVGLS